MSTPVAKSRVDDELTDLLTKLYAIQEDIGAKPKTSDDEKKNKAENIAVMGKGKKAEKKGSRFLELKSTIVDRLKNIHSLLKETKEKEAAGFGGDNAKEIIKMQAEIREHIRQAGDEWKEMDEIYKKEARKKKSKFTPEELEIQSELVKRLYVEIEKVKEAQMRGYARGRDAGTAVTLNTQALYADAGAYRHQCDRIRPSFFIAIVSYSSLSILCLCISLSRVAQELPTRARPTLRLGPARVEVWP
jgi:hypothetical protein